MAHDEFLKLSIENIFSHDDNRMIYTILQGENSKLCFSLLLVQSEAARPPPSTYPSPALSGPGQGPGPTPAGGRGRMHVPLPAAARAASGRPAGRCP